MKEKTREAIKTELTEAAKTAVETAAKTAVENKKKEIKKKAKKRVRRIVRRVFFGLFLLSFGCLIGIHRNVIRAYLGGGDMPKAPYWHIWCK